MNATTRCGRTKHTRTQCGAQQPGRICLQRIIGGSDRGAAHTHGVFVHETGLSAAEKPQWWRKIGVKNRVIEILVFVLIFEV
jgi:hypothetical protein